ncbi:aminoglycoside N(3)-acetyltransferase [Oerskovia paurometabola]|uniref:aminoglycoside N(3)-acetyltransferase n=1 Tax=Oerskovia paurometabola TaxID=162170 RepID=UPI00380E3168
MTKDDLTRGLAALGLRRGDVTLVHSSLSSFGVVIGGEQTILAALADALGPEGTLVMPAQSWQLCDPDFLDDPLLDDAARRTVRSALPAFDPHLTPTRSMGAVAELFRSQPGAVRSQHPHRSFAAQGPLASQIVADHEIADPFGPSSPLARLVDLDAAVLLLGVGFDKCTALHHAEVRSGLSQDEIVTNGARALRDDQSEWVTWSEPHVRSDDFDALGKDLETGSHPDEPSAVARVTIGRATCRAVRLRTLMTFADAWFDEHRG